jgi:hypothetical protein
MGVLSERPMDGTYDQSRPIHLLARLRPKEVYSFYLKSATDRWPIDFIDVVFRLIFGSIAAHSFIAAGLFPNSFYISSPHFKVQRRCMIGFQTGQPLGLYGSWAIFSLSHHCLVWLAARLALPTGRFNRYALLGDDIVIADSRVAEVYWALIDSLGVEVSVSQSLVSDTGCLEFAKKFWVKCLSKDLSPISFRAVNVARTTLTMCAFAQHYSLERGAMLRFAGAGYRVRAKPVHLRSRQWRRLHVAASQPPISDTLAFEYWLGEGVPLNPYIKGMVMYRLIKK